MACDYITRLIFEKVRGFEKKHIMCHVWFDPSHFDTNNIYFLCGLGTVFGVKNITVYHYFHIIFLIGFGFIN